MKLLLAIIISTILGLILFSLNISGVVIAFGIITGSLFWIVYKLMLIEEKLFYLTEHLHVKEEVEQLSNEEIERELEKGFEEWKSSK